MKPRTLVLLAIAGSCGLVSMLGVQQVMTAAPAKVKVPTTKVLVALDNIETGVKLSEQNTAFKAMPLASVPEDAVTSPEEFDERAAKVPFMSGDVIRKSKLTEKGEWGKSVGIPPGMRVIGIPVDDSHTISGLIRPGDRVDVLVTYQARSKRGGPPVSKTKTLLEYVEVFGMDDQTASNIDAKGKGVRAKIASLIVTPEQAGYVILAQRKGSLSLSWRRRGDDELAQTKAVDEKLMEELEGTVGVHDGGFDSYYDQESGYNSEVGLAETGQDPRQFLEETASEVPTVSERSAPTWTVEIYSGNEVVPQQFELPVETTAQPEKIKMPFGIEQSLFNIGKGLKNR